MGSSFLSAALASALLLSGAVSAQEAWPNRPIRLVIPFDPGAGSDAIHRYFGGELSKAVGQPVVVENISGAGGSIGATRVARSPADGYTLLGTLVTAVAALPHLQRLPYDPVKDFTHVARLGYPVTLIGVNNETGISTLQELIARARKEPGKLAFGSAGIGSAPQFRLEALMSATGIAMTHVPYKGGSAYVSDLLAGRIQVFADGTLGISLGKAGKVKLLAVLDEKRVKEFPELPAIHELVPNYKIPPTWFLVQAPAGLPPAIRTRIATELAKISQRKETAEFLDTAAIRPSSDSPDFNLAAEVQAAYDMYGEMIKRLNIKAP